MPESDGLAATRLIKAEMPQIKIVMLTVSASDEHLFEAIKSGAADICSKAKARIASWNWLPKLKMAVPRLPPELASRLLDEFARQAQHVEAPVEETPSELTARQVEVLTLVAQG